MTFTMALLLKCVASVRCRTQVTNRLPVDNRGSSTAQHLALVAVGARLPEREAIMLQQGAKVG
jgi:hypothetical protein